MAPLQLYERLEASLIISSHTQDLTELLDRLHHPPRLCQENLLLSAAQLARTGSFLTLSFARQATNDRVRSDHSICNESYSLL